MRADGFGLGPDEDEAALLHPLGEIRVLGQEAIARMDGDRVGDLRGADDRRHVEIARRRGRRSDADRLVGQQHVLEAVVRRGVHGDRLDSQLPAGAQDSQRNLAAVGDNDLLQHGQGAYSTTKSGWPNSTGSPLRAMTEVTLPALSDSIWFIIFMASMMHRTWPTLISSPISMNAFAPGEGDA